MVTIRLTRTGRKHLAHYKVVVTPNREKRDSKFIEYVGFFSPHTKECKLEKERIEYWLSVGAQPSETVKALLIKNKIIEKPKKKKKYADKAGKKATERAKKAVSAVKEEKVESPAAE